MSFIQAGNEAVRAALKARIAAERNKPKYDELGKQAIKDQTAQDLLSMEIRGRAQEAALTSKSNQKTREINREAKEFAKEQVRSAKMAGKLAGGAALIGSAYFMSKRKDEPDERIGMLQGWIQENKDKNRQEAEKQSSRATEASTETVTENDVETSILSGPKPTSSGVFMSEDNQSLGWRKLATTIRFGEGTLGSAGYNTQFTGTKFTDTSKHPRELRSGGGYTSDAAGAYQFLSTTWDRAKNALGLQDFSPESQEKAGRYLTQQRGVNPDQVFKTKAEFKEAMDKLAPEWASLPYSGISPSGHGRGSSYYGQGGKTLDQLWEIYQGA